MALCSRTRGKERDEIDIVKSRQENNVHRERSRRRDISLRGRSPLRSAQTAVQCLDISRAVPTTPCCNFPASLAQRKPPSALCRSKVRTEETQLCREHASSAIRCPTMRAEHSPANQSASDIRA